MADSDIQTLHTVEPPDRQRDNALSSVEEDGADPPRIAIYQGLSAPTVFPVAYPPADESEVPAYLQEFAQTAYDLAKREGGSVPFVVFRELIENLVHASFRQVVITIMDGGNTIRVSDRGPGIIDKDSAQRPGFTTATAGMRRYIRGVGSGLAVAKRTLLSMEGSLDIEDNLGHGTVITVRVRGAEDGALASAPKPSYNLSQRQLTALLLTVELSPVGPTRLAQELGVSTSTAYRELLFLEEAGFVTCLDTGQRSATDTGLAYLNTLM